MEIKGITFESGKTPVVCVPIMGKDKEEVISEAIRVVEAKAPMVEWRLDYLTDFKNMTEIAAILKEMQAICQHTPLLVTLRTKEQGGLASLQGKELEQFYLELAKCKGMDFIDVEFFGINHPEGLLRQMKKNDVKIITSHHDFTETPPKEVMQMLFERMAEGGADIVKLAVMPQQLQDVLALLRVTCDFAEEHKEVPVASMSMGATGVISRVCGEVFGSCMTFGTMGDASAPGQMPVEELQEMLAILHKNYHE